MAVRPVLLGRKPISDDVLVAEARVGDTVTVKSLFTILAKSSAMRLLTLIIALCVASLSACDSPSPEMWGGAMREVTVDGSRFRVFMKPGGYRVEAHRVSVEMLPSKIETFTRAYSAIELATGCKVVAGSLGGDRAIVTARVNCRLP